ncbi:folate-binding protein [Halomonas sp. HP20-15]|uniref:CAF17-like 4Fe-4S cluster assembly/insertion protein YgfZ n=1 Tax=Halomonas sp. HP20-15 TaxID=3085901 RepID=UPI0029828EDB|nr:folate-binding protein [Halomonas sp. HP20-15]MDW5375571.1 folate-binding protein [Halomonas sp. HP20-15]
MSDWTVHLQQHGARFVDDRHVEFDTQESAPSAEQSLLSPLTHFAVLEIAGADAERFLQGQTSAQLKLADGNFAAPTSFCTAKGRMLANGQLMRIDEVRFWLLLDESLLEPLRSHLAKFAVFYKVELTPRDDLAVLGLIGHQVPALVERRLDALAPTTWQQVALGGGVVLRHPGALPRLVLCLPQDEAIGAWQNLANEAVSTGNAVWRLHDIRAGLAWLEVSLQDSYLPQMFNWEALGGISFKKGCYTGQEVVARAHFRGQVKKRLARGRFTGSVLPESGSAIVDADGKSRGDLVVAASDGEGRVEILAVMTTRDVSEPLTVDGQPLEWLDLPYPIERVDPEMLATSGG